MYGGRLHRKDGATGVFDKLLQYGLGIVVFTIGQAGETTHANQVAVATHHGDGLQQMFTLVTIHDNATLGLQFPGSGIHIEHDYIHAEVHGRLLGGQTGAQTIIEEDHHQGLVLTQVLILITVVLDLKCFGHRLLQRADIFYINKCSHILFIF